MTCGLFHRFPWDETENDSLKSHHIERITLLEKKGYARKIKEIKELLGII